MRRYVRRFRGGRLAAGILLCGLGAGVGWSASAEAPLRLTLEACIARAQAASVPLANARRDEEIAAARIGEVRAQVLPQLDATAAYRRLEEGPLGIGGPDQLGNRDQYGAEVGLGQLLYRGGSVQAALQAAALYRDAAALGTARMQDVIQREVTVAFHTALLAAANRQVAEESVAQMRAFAEQTRLRFEQGAAAEFDWLSAQVKLANEVPRAVRAANDAELALEALRQWLYLDDEAAFEIVPPPPPPPRQAELAPLQVAALAQREDLQAARARLLISDQEIRVSQGDYLPAVSLFANYAGQNPERNDPTVSRWDWQWSAGVQARWSLLDGGLRRAELRRKTIERAQELAALDDLERTIRLEVRRIYLDWQAALATWRSTADSVDLARRATEIARVRYEQGLATTLEVSDSQLALSAAQLLHNTAQTDVEIALADLRLATGQSSLDWPPPELNP
ncbi:MAG: TolC family protein [Candidatus Marinimicrobia bacterium]|nr:TolC family protein [Candidatus Neomarinimicrobiota bacterium]